MGGLVTKSQELDGKCCSVSHPRSILVQWALAALEVFPFLLPASLLLYLLVL